MVKQNSITSLFSSICTSLIKKFGNPLFADFVCTKYGNLKQDDGDLFMWISHARHEIGVQPVHYEIRVDGNKLFVEVHVESQILYSCNSRVVNCIRTPLQDLVNQNKLELVSQPKKNNDSNYYWYKIPKQELYLINVNTQEEIDCLADKIFDDLAKLDNLVGNQIKQVIEKVI